MKGYCHVEGYSQSLVILIPADSDSAIFTKPLERNVLCRLFTSRWILKVVEYVPGEVEEVVGMESTLISDERLRNIRVPFAPVVATAGYAQALNRQP